MVLYIDILIFLNFIVNYCFMKLIYILFNEKENIFRLVLSSIVSVIFLFSFLLNYHLFNMIKIFGGFFLILISFKYINRRRLIVSLCLYYILQFSFIGVLSIFNIKGCFCLLILLLISLLIMIIYKKKNVVNNKNYKVYIKINNEEIILDGYLDTGNIACHNNKPIIFIDKKYYNNKLIVDEVITIKTINGFEFINCYKVDLFEILYDNKKISKEVLIAFSDFGNNINCLLNNLLFI